METKKIVLTGGPSSGKSTLINSLEESGHTVLHETARKVLEERAESPQSQEEWTIRQRLMYELQLDQEASCPKTEYAFLDRGAPDTIAYSKHYLGFIPYEPAKQEYHKIFELERLPFKSDGLRIESGDEEAQMIHDKILQTYKEMGYQTIFVPAYQEKTISASISKRLEFILSSI